MKKKWLNQFNYDHAKAHKEMPSGESMTIPEQTLSLRELIDRYTRGQNVEMFEPVYLDEEEDYPDLERMTIQEKLDLSREIGQKIAAKQFGEQLDLEKEIEKVKTGDEKT